jgi:hypothetical protein
VRQKMTHFYFTLHSKLSRRHCAHFRKDRVFRKRDNRDHPNLLSPNVAMQEGCPTPERARTYEAGDPRSKEPSCLDASSPFWPGFSATLSIDQPDMYLSNC